MDKLKDYLKQGTLKEKAAEFGAFIFILIFTFKRISPDLSIGLDNSYAWAINYLFDTDYSTLTKLIYPVGPFGWLIFPLTVGNNLFWVLIFHCLIRLLFISQFYKLNLKVSENKTFAWTFTFFIAVFSNVEFSLIGLPVILLLLNHYTDKRVYLVFAVLIATFSLFIKSSIGINSLAAVFAYGVFIFYKTKSIKSVGSFLFICFLTFFILGALVFKGPLTFLTFFYNTFRYSQGNSHAFSLMADNNWWILGVFFALVLLFPFLQKDKDSRLAYFILLFPLFTSWKHSIGREDITHYSNMITFLFIYWGIIISNTKNKGYSLFFIPIGTVFLFYMNMTNISNYRSKTINVCGINDFVEIVFDFQRYEQNNREISAFNISSNKLSQPVRDKIGNSTIDIIPWDLTLVPANNLNWKPRTTLQSNAFAGWLDKAEAENYSKQDAPEYVFYHYFPEMWGIKSGTTDYKYYLNDLPLSVRSLFDNYKIEEKSNDFLLFKKKESKTFSGATSLKIEIGKWNQWIEVPVVKDGILRAKLNFCTTLTGKVKNFIYKNEIFLIDYQLADNQILTYRFVEGNAKDGLWINPLIIHPETNEMEPLVKRIRFRSTNDKLFDESLNLEWELLTLLNKSDSKIQYGNAFDLFGKNVIVNDQTKYLKIIDFETATDNRNQDKSTSFFEKYSEHILNDQVSSKFSVALDSLWKGQTILNLEVSVRYKKKINASSYLVIESEGTSKPFKESVPLYYDPSFGDWNFKKYNAGFSIEEFKIAKLNIFAWCQTGELNIDYVTIRIW